MGLLAHEGKVGSRDRSWGLAIAALAVLGLAIRIALIVQIVDPVASGPDGPSYDAAARSLLGGLSPWDVWQLRVFPVGYSAALALVYAVFGVGSIWSMLVLQTAALLAAATYLAIAVRRVLGRRVSLILFAGLVLAPAGLESSTSLMYEGILIPVSCAILGALLSWISGRVGPWPLVIMGLATFAGVAVHPRYVAVVLAVMLGSLALGRRSLAPGVALAGSAGAALLVIVGWNFASLGAPGVSSNQGSNLVIGLDAEGRQHCTTAVYEPTDWPLTTPTGDALLAECAFSWILEHPATWVEQVPSKVTGHFAPATQRAIQSSPVPSILQTPGLTVFLAWTVAVLVGLAALLGIWVLQRERMGRTVAYICVGAIAAPLLLSVVFFGLGRFSYSSLPFLFLLSSVGLARLVKR